MHPYRTSPPEPPIAEDHDQTPLAFGVMTVVGAVQVLASLLEPGRPGAAGVLGAACFVAGIAWFLRRAS